MESLMMMVWRMRQDVAMMQTRALIQTLVASVSESESANKEMQDAWNDYKEELFPFQRGRQRRSDEAAMEFLKQEVAKGPLKVTPLQTLTRGRSMLRQRHAEVEELKLRRPRGRRKR